MFRQIPSQVSYYHKGIAPTRQSISKGQVLIRLVFAVATYLFVLFETENARSAEYNFCVFSELGSGRIKVIVNDSDPREEAKIVAERSLCGASCAMFCAASEFVQQDCGDQEEWVEDTTHARSKIYCENEDGSSPIRSDLTLNVQVALSPDVDSSSQSIAKTFSIANSFLTKSQCPLKLAIQEPVNRLPNDYKGLAISDVGELNALLRYPGDVKFVSQVNFCGDNLSTPSQDFRR